MLQDPTYEAGIGFGLSGFGGGIDQLGVRAHRHASATSRELVLWTKVALIPFHSILDYVLKPCIGRKRPFCFRSRPLSGCPYRCPFDSLILGQSGR